MKRILIILIVFLINIFLYCNENYNEEYNKKHDERNDKKIAYEINMNWEYYVGSFIFYLDDYYDSIIDMNKLLSYNHKTKRYEPHKYLGITWTDDYNYNLLFWTKFYQDVYHKNYHRVDEIVKSFILQAKKNKWSRKKLAEVVVKCIQYIRYDRPKRISDDYKTVSYKYDFFTPNEIVLKEAADCDSKAVFLILLLKRLGIDSVILHSAEQRHIMVGVNIESPGTHTIYNGKKYYFVETTDESFKIGQIPEFCQYTRWDVIDLE